MNIARIQPSSPTVTTSEGSRWLCCQLGAREHYSIPRALNRVGLLDRLLTDVWVTGGSLQAALPWQRWKDRFTPEIQKHQVVAWNVQAALFEIRHRWPRRNDWSLVMKRNRWFQDEISQFLLHRRGDPEVLYSYSYTAERAFAVAKQRGWKLVLGQIDPGPVEERIVAKLYAESGQPPSSWQVAPEAYWDGWRQECAFADKILVNSEWSRRALVEAGIECHKIDLVPLVYSSSPQAKLFERTVPAAFSRNRPLRILFLGQANLRKGMAVLLQVMQRMASAPVEFQIVGPVALSVPAAIRSQDNIRWEGAVPRSRTEKYYRDADVFLFPTFSDGFGLTQLEAQSWKLPVIASKFCGDVIEDGVNGILLPQITADAVEAAIVRCLRQPGELAAMSRRSRIAPQFSIDTLSYFLSSLSAEFECSRR